MKNHRNASSSVLPSNSRLQCKNVSTIGHVIIAAAMLLSDTRRREHVWNNNYIATSYALHLLLVKPFSIFFVLIPLSKISDLLVHMLCSLEWYISLAFFLRCNLLDGMVYNFSVFSDKPHSQNLSRPFPMAFWM